MNGASKRIKITDLNPNLICVLCGGYFIDATTLTECLHSFCKKCIVKYLETSKQCPVCDVLVHKTRPHLHIRSDKTLQDLVYKLVPGLYKNEMKRRRDFYSKHPEVAPKKVGEERGDEMAERIIYTEDEHFSLALHFSKRGVRDERSVRSLTLPEVVAVSKEPPKNVRYLRCPAGVTIGILKKFVRLKYELPNRYEIDIFHTDEALHEDYTLMDIAYIYTWRRKDPLRLNYSVYESKAKRPRLAIEPLANTPGLKLVKTEAGATLVKEEDRPSGKQDGVRPLVKPDLKPACAQDKKPASKPEADNKEIKASEKPVAKTQEQQSEGGPPLVLQEDKKRQSTSTDEPAVSPSKQEPRIANLTPPSYVTLDAATPKAAIYSGPQILADKAAVRLGTACAVKILQSSNPSSPSPSPVMKAKPAKPVGNTSRVLSAKVAMTTQVTAVGKSSSQENFLPKSKPVVASGSKILTTSSKASDMQAAVGAAHTPDVIRKAQTLSFPSPAGMPALSRTSSSSCNASTSTKSNGTSQTSCRLAGGVTNICTSSAASTSTTTTTMAVSAPTSSTSDQTPATQSLVLAVSAHDVPVIADAGAAAASATVPAPAALAASSSPSPPMASTAASVKEPEEMQTCSTPTSTPSSSSSSSSSLPSLGPMQPTLRPTPTLAKMALTAQKTARPAELRANTKATDAKIVTTPKSAMPEVTQSSALPATGKGAAASCVASSKTAACSKTFARKSEEMSRVATVSSSDEGVTEKDRPAVGEKRGSENNRKDDKITIGSPVTSSSSKVAVGIPTFVSTNCDSAASVAGRVCNGMPPVVTRMLRMSNASTSVNTLPQKLHAKVGQQQQQQQQQVSQQAARSLSRNTPSVVQPAALPATTHSLVRTSPGSAIAVAMAKRRASEMQAMHHQQQQLQQQLQLIQQHQLLSIQAAAAARWSTDVLSPSPPRVPAMTPSASSPTSANTLAVVTVQSGGESCSSRDPREVSGISPPSKKQEGSGQQQLMKQQKHGMYKKLAEASPSKKKISDIANTLHKKISQSCGGSPKADLVADAKRPPNAHSASKAKAPEAAAGGQQAHAHSKTSFTANSASGDREDEPLNLVTRDKESHRHSNRGASPRVQTTTAV